MFRRLIVFVFVLLGSLIAAGQQRSVCNETSKDTPIVVKNGERIVLETRGFPDGYPNISCGFNLQPENANISFNIVFEYFLLSPTDALTFANSEGAVLESLSGNGWMNRRDFIFSTANRSDVSGNISLNLNVQNNARSGGFRAWVIGYDRTTPFNNSNCGKNVTLDKGESFMYLSPSASGAQNINSSDPCTTTVIQANKYIQFRAVINYVDIDEEDEIVIYDGTRSYLGGHHQASGVVALHIYGENMSAIHQIQLANLVRSEINDFEYTRITELMKDAKSPIKFDLYYEALQRPGGSTYQSAYFIVVQAFFKDQPCPDSGMTFDLVNDGPNNLEGNLMKPFTFTTSKDDFVSYYANDLECEWTVTVPNPAKYVIAVWFKVFETEECCDKLEIGNSHTFPQPSFSGALIDINGVPWNNETAPVLLYTTNRLVFTFTSDSIRNGLGMLLEVRSLPVAPPQAPNTPVTISVPSNITTPGYPYAYESNQFVEWRFVGENGSALFFRIINENANDILLDEARHTSITFYDGPFTSDPILKRFDKNSGNETLEEFNREFRTTQQYLTVRFTTQEYRLSEDPDNATDIGILFTVGRIPTDEVDNSTTTSPATNTSLTDTTTATLPDTNATTTILPDTNATTTILPDTNATTTIPPATTTTTILPTTTTTTTIATTTTRGPAVRGSAHSVLPDHRAMIMTMILMISSIALYCY